MTKPGELYIGVSWNVIKRLGEHNSGSDSYTSKYKPWKIVLIEEYDNPISAFHRECQIKRWSKKKKEALINKELVKLKYI